MNKLTFWTRYDSLGASSRLRFLQFIPELEKLAWDITVHPFFPNEYLQRLYAGNGKSVRLLIQSWFRRCRSMLREAPEIPAVIEYELLPYLPYLPEKIFLRKHPYILNFDDAVDLRYERIPVLSRKYPYLLRHASGVIVANEMLREKFSPYNPNIIKLPTCPPPLMTAKQKKSDIFTIVWIGTPVTFAYLYERRSALQLAAKRCRFELLIVGGTRELPDVPCRVIPWSENAENIALASAHIGVMPLPDTPFARGKSAYKLIRYLQNALPAIASPVGENCHVLQDKITGYFARSDEEWAHAIIKLAQADERERMIPAIMASGQKYSQTQCANELDRFFRTVW